MCQARSQLPGGGEFLYPRELLFGFAECSHVRHGSDSTNYVTELACFRGVHHVQISHSPSIEGYVGLILDAFAAEHPLDVGANCLPRLCTHHLEDWPSHNFIETHARNSSVCRICGHVPQTAAAASNPRGHSVQKLP